MNVIGFFDQMRQRHPHRAALLSGIGRERRRISYRDLGVRVDRAVQRLRESSLRPGDRVLLAVPLSAETYVAMLAILKAGLVIVFVDPAHGRKAFARCLRAHPPAALIANRRILRLRWFSPELRKIPQRFTVDAGRGRAVSICDSKSGDVPQESAHCTIDDPALLTFTSGSTGEPKAVIRTHGFLGNQFDILGRVAEVRPDDVDLVAMPMFVLFNLANGITSVVPACDVRKPGRADPESLSAQINAENVTRIVASPALLARLANHCAAADKQIPGIRRISTGGGPVPPSLPDRLLMIAPGASIVSVYGSTEAEPIASIDNQSVSSTDLRRMCAGAGLLAGEPVEGCDVRVIQIRHGPVPSPCPTQSFESLALADTCVGEIVVSGKHVLRGYADATRNAETKIDVNGTLWHRTGDAGYFDTRGRLWLVGRCSAVISDARGAVYPFQVEYAACNVDGIRRAALVAVEGKRVLVVETDICRPKVDEMTVTNLIADLPVDRIVPVRHIPMDKRHNAKVDYPALRRLLKI